MHRKIQPKPSREDKKSRDLLFVEFKEKVIKQIEKGGDFWNSGDTFHELTESIKGGKSFETIITYLTHSFYKQS